jgi:hypothetical protein
VKAFRFLNVDIDLVSQHGFEALLARIGDKILVLRADDTVLSFELGYSPSTADDAAIGVGRLVDDLPTDARLCWNRCQSREFNIGVEGGAVTTEIALTQATIDVLSRIGLSIRVTVYPARET